MNAPNGTGRSGEGLTQPSGGPLTVREAYAQASSFLRKKKVADASVCAEMLLCRALGCDRSAFLLRLGEPMPTQALPALEEGLRRKAAGEPVQYIIGEQAFYGLTFSVNPSVLIPRPETELLVERVVELVRRLWPEGSSPPLVADIGTGSGAIAVAVAAHCPDARVVASDLSEAALATAQANARRHRLDGRIEFVHGDLLEPFIARKERIDALVSNPPYIPAGDLPGLQPEVLCEPRMALDGGPDGLVPYRRIVVDLPRLPQLPRLIAFEVGFGQAQEVARLLETAFAWQAIEIVPDLAGIDRHVVAWR